MYMQIKWTDLLLWQISCSGWVWPPFPGSLSVGLCWCPPLYQTSQQHKYLTSSVTSQWKLLSS